MQWFHLALGVWIMLSPWILGFASISILMWSNLAAGLALVLTSLWAIYGRE